MAHMRPARAVVVEPNATITAEPGGLHLMLYKPYAPMKEGDKPVITLKLKDGRSLPVTFEVRKTAP